MSLFRLTVLLAAFLSAAAHAAPPLKADDLPAELTLPEPPVERRVWNKVPIQINLPINQERLVTFNSPVRADLPAALNATVLRTQIVADTHSGTVYWTAHQPFTTQRVQIQDIRTDNIYLVDLTALETAKDTTRIDIRIPGETDSALPVAESKPAGVSASQPAGLDTVALTQLAARQLYAPERLLQLPDGVFRAPVRTDSTLDLYRGAQLNATPVAAWRSGDLTVYAVKLVNQSAGDLILDPRHLKGRWLTACFHHNLLKAKGQVRDTTALYLIAQGSFEDSLDGH